MEPNAPSTPSSGMYDTLAAEYDRFVDWPARLALEIPFLEKALRDAGARTIADTACGTGMHALALAARGFIAAGADASAGMIDRARMNAAQAGAAVQFEIAGFGDIAGAFNTQRFDALLCLGNSLPHAGSLPATLAALSDFAACLRPGGRLILQNRNFDAILARRERWMPLQARQDGGSDRLFLRSYDFEADGTLTFWMILLGREAGGTWTQSALSSRLYPLRREELLSALDQTSFTDIHCYGDAKGSNFDPAISSDLWIIATRLT
jgi:glycine/sarcosine N-methyltransferase